MPQTAGDRIAPVKDKIEQERGGAGCLAALAQGN